MSRMADCFSIIFVGVDIKAAARSSSSASAGASAAGAWGRRLHLCMGGSSKRRCGMAPTSAHRILQALELAQKVRPRKARKMLQLRAEKTPNTGPLAGRWRRAWRRGRTCPEFATPPRPSVAGRGRTRARASWFASKVPARPSRSPANAWQVHTGLNKTPAREKDFAIAMAGFGSTMRYDAGEKFLQTSLTSDQRGEPPAARPAAASLPSGRSSCRAPACRGRSIRAGWFSACLQILGWPLKSSP